MKKIILPVFFLTLINTSFAQKTKIGIAIGTNYTTYKSDFTYNKNVFKLGVLFGANFEYAVTKNTSLKTGVFYEQRKRSIEILLLPDGNVGTEGIPYYITTEKINNIILPLLLKFNLGQSKRLFINSGFTINFLKNTKIDNGEPTRFTQTDLNLSIGTGYKLKIFNNSDLNFEMRYSPYLANLSKDDGFFNLKMTPLNLIISYDLDL